MTPVYWMAAIGLFGCVLIVVLPYAIPALCDRIKTAREKAK